MTARRPEITPDGMVVAPEPSRKNGMDRFIDSIEWIAAFFVGIVALNTFLAVFMRKFFAVTIPDYYNFGQFLLGILIFWGIAATSYRGSHITVDLVWANATPKYQRWIDVFATLVLLFVVTVQTYTLFDKVISTRAEGIVTMDLQVPIWPFFLVSWIGDVAAVLLIAVRTWRLVFHSDHLHDPHIKTVE
ncbi:MAG: transporter small permease [Tardiphaga sp.]|nr:transporter small permease [Tardiphaga sp.]MDB5626214.1 transporter small permease [Tardiphaga sp.]